MSQGLTHEKWSGRTGGTKWMQQSLIACFRFSPLWLFYVILTVVVPFYMLFNRKGYTPAYQYFRRCFGYGRMRAFAATYANHYRFGQIIIDRFARYAGKSFTLNIENESLFRNLSSGEGSFMILSAHVGNYEMVGYTFASSEKPINVLVYGKEAETVMRNRASLFAKTNIRMMAVKEDMSHLFMINNALRDGEIVSMPADRLFGSPRGLRCSFFGSEATFPKGPFATATQRAVPAISIFAMKSGYRKYDVRVVRLCDRDEQVTAGELAQRFATEIEKTLRNYRTQWFNYYDFWR